MENDSPGTSGRGGPFRLKFGWPVVLRRNLDHSRRRSGACGLQPSVNGSRLCDAGGVGHAAPGGAAVAFALASASIARELLAQSTGSSSGQFCMLSKHAEILPKQAEIVLERAEKLGKELTGW